MAKGQGGKFTTQIIYRRDGIECVVGYIASYECAGDWLQRYRWSRDGKRWSRKWLSYDEAIRKLLIETGYQKTDDYHIVPLAETQRNLWK